MTGSSSKGNLRENTSGADNKFFSYLVSATFEYTVSGQCGWINLHREISKLCACVNQVYR